MKKLIDIENIKPIDFPSTEMDGLDVVQYLNTLPTVDAAAVRHGLWIDRPTGRCGQWQAWCSVCNKKCGCGGTLETQHKIFCPNCGVKMDGGDE